MWNASSSNPQRTVTVLLISPVERDHLLFQQAFGRSNWKLFRAYSLREGLEFLQEHDIPVIVSERNLDKEGWQRLMPEIANLPVPPKVIVTSSEAGADLWSEVLNLGGYDLLVKPIDERELFQAISQAWLSWKRESQGAEVGKSLEAAV